MAVSNATAISVPKSATNQLGTLLKYLDRAPSIIEASKKIGYGVTVFQVIHPLSEEVKLPYSEVEAVFLALENLRYLEIEFGSAESAFVRLTSSLEGDLSREITEKKDAILSLLKEYGTDNPVSISIKAQRLAYFHENIFRDAEIVTDARPVFDTAAGKVLEIIVSHSLVATYSSSNQTNRIHLQMDAADVLKLRTACDRAITKAATLKKVFSGADQKWKIQLLRDDDGS